MSKLKARRSISVRGSTYERLSAYCKRHDLSRSQFVEDRIAEFLGEAEVEVDVAPEPDDSPKELSVPEPAPDPVEETQAPVSDPIIEQPLPEKDKPFDAPEPEKPTLFRPDVSDADEFAGGYREF